MRIWRSASVVETQALGRELAEELAPDGVLLLYGALGAGKTALVRGLAEGLGLDPNEVQSPTYTLVREHSAPGRAGGAPRMVHIDLYRLDADEAAAVGIEEALLGAGVKAVEWAERLPFVPAGALALTIERGDEIAGEGEGRTIRERASAQDEPAPR